MVERGALADGATACGVQEQPAAGPVPGRGPDEDRHHGGGESPWPGPGDPDFERRAHEAGTPLTLACTATYATGRCPSSSHLISLVAWGLWMPSGRSGTPETPRHLWTPAFPRPPAGRCSKHCAPPGLSARTVSNTPSPTGWASRRGTHSSSRHPAPRVNRRAWC